MHDQVRTDRRGGLAAVIRMPSQSLLDPDEPVIELVRTAAIHRRERADHPVAACGYHKFDAGDEKHRRRDQRQAQAVAKARKRIGYWQGVSSRLEQRPLCASVAANFGTMKGRRQSNRYDDREDER